MAFMFKFPLDLDSNTEEYPARITFQAIRASIAGKAKPGDIVALYLPPDALKTSYQQQYGDVDAGAMAIAMNKVGVDQAAGLAGAAMNMEGKDMFSQLKNILSESAVGGSLASAAVKETIGRAGNLPVVQLLQRKAGIIMNPHKAVIYQGPGGFRTFDYSFTMSPQSKEEANEVFNIVKFFKYHMHPGIATVATSTSTTTRTVGPPDMYGPRTETKTKRRARVTTGGNIDTSATLTYPEEFEIQMNVQTKKGSKNTLFRINKCFLQNLSVDYSTSGGPAFFQEDGEPVTTTMALSFKETKLITKESIEVGY